jgi:glycosyltransferase involved in cell wall biosynthesis
MRQAVYRHGNDLDLFYFPSVYTYFPPKTRARVIVTIHDTTAERYPKLIFPNRRSRLFWKLKVELAVRRADLIATVSEASKQEIIREFGVPEARVSVISDAVGAEFYPLNEEPKTREVIAKYGVNVGEPFILYVGGISPHKNLHTLVDAHALLGQESGAPSANLVLVGDYQRDVFYSSYTSLREKIDGLGTTDKVVFTGFVDDTDLMYFYNAASVLVMPSYDEGFGLPALEAMACGTPVIVSNAGALPEVVGSAGRLFSPHSPQHLKDHLATVLSDRLVHDTMSRMGLQRAREFSWERSAQAALTAFSQLGRNLEPATA